MSLGVLGAWAILGQHYGSKDCSWIRVARVTAQIKKKRGKGQVKVKGEKGQVKVKGEVGQLIDLTGDGDSVDDGAGLGGQKYASSTSSSSSSSPSSSSSSSSSSSASSSSPSQSKSKSNVAKEQDATSDGNADADASASAGTGAAEKSILGILIDKKRIEDVTPTRPFTQLLYHTHLSNSLKK